VVVNVLPVSSDDEDILTSLRLLAARQELGVHGVRIYDVLGSRSLELHLEVKDSLTVAEAHDQATAFEGALHEAFPHLARVVTHIEPIGERALTREARPVDERRLREAIASLPEGYGIACEPHDVVINRVGGEISVSFHCSLDPTLGIADAHALTETLESVLRAQVPNLGRVVIHVEPSESA